MKTIAVFGANGQLGTALQNLGNARDDISVVPVTRQDCDLEDEGVLADTIKTLYEEKDCRVIVNSAAYTGVDTAEDEPEKAFSVNAGAVEHIAKEAAKYDGLILIHISTDFVFDGEQSTPYDENSPANPLSVYGLSKLKGEMAVRASMPSHIILRISWLFSPDGNNFLKTMLSLAETRSSLSVVSDQWGSPTYSYDVAQTIFDIVEIAQKPEFNEWGIYHYAGDTPTSWHGFAKYIFEQQKQGAGRVPDTLEAIESSQYPQKAVRPKYSYLNTDRLQKVFGVLPCDWKKGVRETLKRIQI